MSRLTRDGTAGPVSRDQILRHVRGQGNIRFPCSADHEQDWQPYPVDPYSAICDDYTYILTNRQQSVVDKQTDQPKSEPHEKYEDTHCTKEAWKGRSAGRELRRRICPCLLLCLLTKATVPHSRGCENCGIDRACRRRSGHQERVIIRKGYFWGDLFRRNGKGVRDVVTQLP